MDTPEAAADAVRQWAHDFDQRHQRVRDPDRLRVIWQEEKRARGGPIRRAMASLEFGLFITALVHYQAEGITRTKVKIASAITGEPISRRGYYDKLDRVHYFVAGCVFEQSHAAA